MLGEIKAPKSNVESNPEVSFATTSYLGFLLQLLLLPREYLFTFSFAIESEQSIQHLKILARKLPKRLQCSGLFFLATYGLGFMPRK